MTTECPTCGRDDFKSERGMKTHHSLVHDESISGKEVECKQCGETVRRKPNHIEKQENTFCSRECKSNYERTERIEKQCKECGDVFRTPQWIDADHCSDSCWGGLEKHTCVVCGEEFTRRRSKENARFCSCNCQHQWQKENWVGEDAPAWKGGYPGYYGESWQRKRREVLYRDQYRCQKCGKTQPEIGKEPSVHHIVPVRLFDSPEDAHIEQNMISLCNACHNEVEVWDVRKQIERLRVEDGQPDSFDRLTEILEDV